MSGRARPLVGSSPVWVTELDLVAPPPRLVAPPPPGGVGTYELVYLLLRVGSEPLAMANHALVDGELDVAAVIDEATATHGARIDELARRSLRVCDVLGHDTPPISVVIGTYRRPEKVAACVARVLKQGYPAPFEVIVVENGRIDDATERILADRFGADARVRHLSILEPGLSRARNVGLAAAHHPITAFLSDDILVDSHWMLAIARGFARHDDVRCVLGYCPQLYLDTEQQQTFEHLMRWGSENGFEPFLASDAGRADPLHPYRIASYNGSNMSFDTDYFRRSGGFDEALGPGTPARGGEDLDAPVRVLLAGHDVSFEPAALGWHNDEQAGRGFASHMFTYGLGLTAFLASHALDPRCRRPLFVRAIRGARYVLPSGPAGSASPFPRARVRRRYWLANVAGRLAGPVALVRSRRAGHRIGPVEVSGATTP
ncbi:MAG: glycosyltransferase [Acidimicrobiales bacterium]